MGLALQKLTNGDVAVSVPSARRVATRSCLPRHRRSPENHLRSLRRASTTELREAYAALKLAASASMGGHRGEAAGTSWHWRAPWHVARTAP